jgi:UDP-MurNAc hydroxylase
MLILKSDSLNFIFNNNFGFDTLTINGCFEEGMQGGFIEASKSLAVENLNNLGYSIGPSIFFNYKLIGLFIQRLLEVSKKIKSNIA